MLSPSRASCMKLISSSLISRSRNSPDMIPSMHHSMYLTLFTCPTISRSENCTSLLPMSFIWSGKRILPSFSSNTDSSPLPSCNTSESGRIGLRVWLSRTSQALLATPRTFPALSFTLKSLSPNIRSMPLCQVSTSTESSQTGYRSIRIFILERTHMVCLRFMSLNPNPS